MADSETIIRATGLKKYFQATKHGILETLFRVKPLYVRAVDDVDIEIKRKQVVTLVGESGSGKTTLGRVLATLEKPDSGKIFFEDKEVTGKGVDLMRKKIQVVFQNPTESLDPRMSIADVVAEPLAKLRMNSNEVKEAVRNALNEVGLDYSTFAGRRPADVSGGQRQRIAVARAIVSNPKFIVLDEPTSALDASVQAQVLNLLIGLHNRYGFSYLFITHNIAVARYIADVIAVMYAGKIVEIGPTQEVMTKPKHPYTQALLK
ncbi:MAG: ATP-binding cassette domain-containing protein, partial [Thermoprotei archaeon]